MNLTNGIVYQCAIWATIRDLATERKGTKVNGGEGITVNINNG